jgi:integrase
MGLRKREVDALTFNPNGSAKQVVWDGSLPGFGVRVFPSGVKSFILQRRVNGRERLVTLGRYGALTPQQARDLAVQELAKIARGIDPAQERRAKREAAKREKHAVTLRQFADIYIERHSKPRNRTWRAERRRLDKNILPRLGTRPLADITRADVANLHARIGKRSRSEANLHASLLSSMRSRAIEWGFLPENTGSWKVEKFALLSRERWVRPHELPALLVAIDAEENPHVRGALHIALLTGMRRGEILTLRWKDVDLVRNEIRLANTKANRPHTVPLVPEAVAVLESLPRMLGNPYVFPSPVSAGERMYDLNRPWDRVRARLWLAEHPDEAATLRTQAEADIAARSKHAGVHEGRDAVEDRLLVLAAKEAVKRGEALRLHDVRRTTGSMLRLAGADLTLIAKVLNHSQLSTTQIYARLTEDAPRAALEKVAAAVRAAHNGA